MYTYCSAVTASFFVAQRLRLRRLAGSVFVCLDNSKFKYQMRQASLSSRLNGKRWCRASSRARVSRQAFQGKRVFERKVQQRQQHALDTARVRYHSFDQAAMH
jgi:hypothetical protein